MYAFTVHELYICMLKYMYVRICMLGVRINTKFRSYILKFDRYDTFIKCNNNDNVNSLVSLQHHSTRGD